MKHETWKQSMKQSRRTAVLRALSAQLLQPAHRKDRIRRRAVRAEAAQLLRQQSLSLAVGAECRSDYLEKNLTQVLYYVLYYCCPNFRWNILLGRLHVSLLRIGSGGWSCSTINPSYRQLQRCASRLRSYYSIQGYLSFSPSFMPTGTS